MPRVPRAPKTTTRVILAGDIGGTKSVLGLFEDVGDRLRLIREIERPTTQFPSVEAMIEAFLPAGEAAQVRAACLGVAGPVVGGRAKTTNLPWIIDSRELAKHLPHARIALLNDLQATGVGALHLEPSELLVLNEGARPRQPGTVAVIAAGTGLGEGFLFWDGERYHPGASEGGHVDFAPRNADEWELLRFLSKEFPDHVSYERVLSGPGLVKLYEFERMRGGARNSAWTLPEADDEDPAAAVSKAALAGEDAACVAALDRFVELYGAEAGNLALKVMALGGVFVAGGIAPKILPALANGRFVSAFTTKGRFASLLEQVPVQVVLNTRAALLGAAHFARGL